MKIKKIAVLFLAVVMIFSITAISASASSGHGGDYGVVKGDAVRFRTSTSISSDSNVLCLLNKGDIIQIISYKTDSGYKWAKGTLDEGPSQFIGREGYVATNYLNIYQT